MKLSDMFESNVMKFVASEDELVGKDCIRLFTTYKVSVIAFHLYKKCVIWDIFKL